MDNIARKILVTSKKRIKRNNFFIYSVIKSVRFIKNFVMDSNYRSISILKLFKSKSVHQTTPLTYMNRYPSIFTSAQDYFGDKKNLKILSYGCSTGEEVLTLRQYFPNAEIVGAEINKRSLKACKELSVDEKINFVYSKISEIRKLGPFDAIFCMAVFQRNPHDIVQKGIKSLQKIYPFEKFESQIIELDKLINPTGLLVIHYTQYSFFDTKVAPKYHVFGDCNQRDYISPMFDKKSNIVEKPTTENSIFVKLPK